MPDDVSSSEPQDKTPVPQRAFTDALDRMVGMINDLGKEIDAEAANRRTEQALLITSIKNVQTQLLEKQGRFNAHKSSIDSSTGGATPPTHKLRFPKFDGSGNPLVWLQKAKQIFRATPPSQQVWTPFFYMDGAASHWYFRCEKNLGAAPSWEDFAVGVNRRFGPPHRANPLGELSHLRRTDSVHEYQEAFLNLLARCEGVTEKQYIALFTSGLMPPLSVDLKLHNPETLEDVMGLHARTSSASRSPMTRRMFCPARQHHLVRRRVHQRPQPHSVAALLPPWARRLNHPFRQAASTGSHRRRWRATACFNCPEKFSREHAKQCSMWGIYYM
jgi:hypothetical protein